jgi:two-component system response regulator GlrR
MTRVLVVEDDAWLAEGIVAQLEKAGYDVAYAAHAQAAVARIDDSVPDIIVADMMLTGTTVLALLHELQSYGDTKAIPVVLCTNSADVLQIETLRPYGVKRIIDKTTMQPEDVVVAVRGLV